VRRSNRLLILFGIFLAVVSMILVVALSGGGGGGGGGGGAQPKGTPTPTPEPQVAVVIAKTDISLGEKITSDMVTTQNMTISDRDALPGQPYTSTSQVVGKVAGGSIKKGDILYSDTSFMQQGTYVLGQDLAPAIDSGYVAMSMEFDQVNGVGSLIVSGDRVDVILSVWVDKLDLDVTTNSGKTEHWPLGGEPTTKIVIQNRKVLAVLLPPVASEGGGAAPVAGASPTPRPKPTSQVVTNNGAHMIAVVQVLPEEAEVIRWAQRAEVTGSQNYITLGLALRSDKDNDAPDAKTLGITFKELVTRYGVLPPDFRAKIPPDLAKLFTW
jgi:Flp pilus assembly protein CpaB